MSVKRQATTELNHENWDQDDPADQEEGSGFKMASKEVLEKRVIRTAKRRSQATGDEAKKSVFSGFSGFNKTQPSSFNFLANLTNGNKANNGMSTNKNDVTEASNSNNDKPATDPNTNVFGLSGTSTPIAKSTFGKQNTESPIFGNFSQTVFAPKPNSTGNASPFNSPPVQNSTLNSELTSKTNENAEKTVTQGSSTVFSSSTSVVNSPMSPFTTSTTNNSSPFKTFKMNENAEKTVTQGSSTVFSSSTSVANSPMSPFTTSTTNNSSPFKTLKMNENAEKTVTQGSSTVFSSSTCVANSPKSPFTTSTTNNSSPFKTPPVTTSQPIVDNKTAMKPAVQEDYKLIYYGKLKGLNESVSAWIKKHVDESPVCILTPIFKDYEKHLSNIQSEYEKDKNKNVSKENTDTKPKQNNANQNLGTQPSSSNTGSSLFSATKSSTLLSSNISSTLEKTSNFTFGINTMSTAISSTSTFSPSTSTFSTSTTMSTGFSLGVKPSTTSSSPFAINTTTTGTSNTPFSFGTGKPFSFNANIKKPDEPAKETEENEDEPPKVEYTPIVEDNSVFDKKCKVFVKKDGNFIDKGVGTLYIKKIEESGKHQLLVRANTTMGNILLNFILSSSITTQRMGKNNVMMVCIPTPDAKPPPTPILIRVKTSEEADELLETLNKYKV